ncbi:MAG: pyridoxal-phosphate dependent enzyme [Rhizobacter sp.]
MIDVEYRIDQVTLHDSSNPYLRFADLLPVESALDRLPSDACFTPTLHARRLGRHLGLAHLYLKNETVLPTGTTKDRMAAVSLAYLWESGVRTFCTSSTGNSSTSYALAIRAYPDMRLYVFTAESFLSRVMHGDHPQVIHFCMRGASFVEASEFSAVYAKRHGLVAEGGFFNLGRREGLKLAFLEACDQIERPIDWYVQAVSSAMGVYGTYKGACELQRMGRLERLPKTLCVQQASCAPMAQAFSDGASGILPHHVVPKPQGIAHAILRGDPSRAYPYIRRIAIESGGDIVSVSEAEIRNARQLIEELEGLSPCFSASAAVAGLIQKVLGGAFPKDETILVNLTGSDRQDVATSPNIRWMRRHADDWLEEVA